MQNRFMRLGSSTDNVYKLESIAVVLRSGEYSYISLETALSQYSIISQMTINTLTIITTGRSQTYTNTYTYRQSNHPLRIATPALALNDLKRVQRNC